MRELALFAGGGGGILGGHLLGWQTVCAVEIEKYPRNVLLARQRDGIFPRFPVWDDIRTFDGTEWRGRCDIITGGFPCQDISCAGKGAGIGGKKSGLWKEMSRVVREVRPEFVFVENSPALTRRGIDVVLKDLAKMGYNARWCVLGADALGAPHKRERIWILAYSDSHGLSRDELRKAPHQTSRGNAIIKAKSLLLSSWPPGPGAQSKIPRMDDGQSHRVDRLKALGNGQVPAVAALAFIILSEGLIYE